MKNQLSIAALETLEPRTLMSASLMSGHETEIHSEPHAPGIIIPAKPTNLAGTVDGTHVILTWTDNSDNELGFVIFRACGKSKGLKLIGRVDANATTFTDLNVTDPNDTYVVRSYGTQHNSEPSNAVTVSVESLITVIAPKKLRSQAVSTTSIKLSWQGDYGATNGYIIERRLAGTTDFTQIGTVAVNVRSFTDTGLTAATRYEYRITAVGPVGHTAVSAVLIGQTKVVRPDRGGSEHGSENEQEHGGGHT